MVARGRVQLANEVRIVEKLRNDGQDATSAEEVLATLPHSRATKSTAIGCDKSSGWSSSPACYWLSGTSIDAQS
jgi:hypothetical protein